MSIALMTLAWKADMPTGRKFVLLSLCDNANDQGECYPSVATIAERCSMGVRTVQGHIADLESAGLLARHERGGRSTVYKIKPDLFPCKREETHYVYRIEDVDSGEFYIGLRTCAGEAASDGYMGSGAWFSERMSDGRALRKSVLQTFDTRQEAAAAERILIAGFLSSALCMNKRTPAESAPRRICAPPPQNLRP